ncbi:MAG: DUF3971 domain-containing protein, partial [Geminicoccaceae bacterium]|nr:DUF3971 domain-containing protein [Geminicoccaceae bacterium]
LSFNGDGVTTTVEATELRIGRERGVALVALGVAARDAGGDVLFELPEVEVGLSTIALLRHQVLAPERLRVRAPKVVLVRRVDGSIGLGGTSGPAESKETLVDLELLAGIVLIEPHPDLPLSFVDLVEVEGASVTLEDEASGTRIEASSGALSVVREGAALAARASVTIDRPGRALGLQALARYDPVRGEIDAALDFADFRPVDLRLVEDLLPEAQAEALGQMPLDGIDLAFDARLRARTDLRARPRSTSFRIGSAGGTLAWPGQLARPLEVEGLTLIGGFDPARRRVTVEQLELVANGATIRATGTAGLTPDGPAIRAEASLRDVEVEQLDALWPVRAADEARAWVTENIQAGRAPSGVVLIDIRPGDLDQRPLRKEAVTGTFAYEDLTIRYFDPLPPVEGVDGTATFDAQTMAFEAEGGRVGELRTDTALITITGIGIKGRDTTQLEVETTIAGPVEDALALIDLPPFGFASELGIDPAAAGGTAVTELDIGLPLHRDVDEVEVRIHAHSTLTDVRISGLFGLADLT